jgi:hypothetical protein
VLAIAFCDRELRDDQKFALTSVKQKFVAAECDDQHVASVRSPRQVISKSNQPDKPRRS